MRNAFSEWALISSVITVQEEGNPTGLPPTQMSDRKADSTRLVPVGAADQTGSSELWCYRLTKTEPLRAWTTSSPKVMRRTIVSPGGDQVSISDRPIQNSAVWCVRGNREFLHHSTGLSALDRPKRRAKQTSISSSSQASVPVCRNALWCSSGQMTGTKWPTMQKLPDLLAGPEISAMLNWPSLQASSYG